MVAVEEARAIAAGRLWLRFTDGATGMVDLARTIPARFAELREAGYFAGVRLIGGGVGWPNGFDCAPEWLRDQLAENGTVAERMTTAGTRCGGMQPACPRSVAASV